MTTIKQKYPLDKLIIKQLQSTDTYESVSKFVEWCFNFIQEQPRGGFHRNHIIYTIAIRLLKDAGIYDTERTKKVLREYMRIPRYVTELDDIDIPDIPDILGITHQVLLHIDRQNTGGSIDYGTENLPFQIGDYITKNIKLSKDATVLDPCCGSGVLLCTLDCDDPTQLYGVDIDLTSCFITRVNLLLKYKDIDFTPNVYQYDFIKTRKLKKTFDYIILNPPYLDYEKVKRKVGGRKELKYIPSQIPFLNKCKMHLNENGKITLIANSRFLTSTAYKESRKIILDDYTIYNAIQFAGFEYFRNTYVIVLQMEKGVLDGDNAFNFVHYDLINDRNLTNSNVNQNSFKLSNIYAFNFADNSVSDLTKYILSKGVYTLKNSTFIVGVMTGDNKNTILQHKNRGLRTPKAYIPISTGKDLIPYKLLKPKSYIIKSAFNRPIQCARRELYAAKEKLVYRYVSAHPLVAYDDSRRIFLNSLYGILPNIPNMSIKTVMAFLNSRVFEFLYKSMYGTNVIIKQQLLALTFPNITPEIDTYLTSQIDAILNTNVAREIRQHDEQIQQCIYTLYGLSDEQIRIIENHIIKAKYTKTGTY